MDDQCFRTSSGRQVHLSAVHIQQFSRGFLEGRAAAIRGRVLATLPDDARRIFPGRTGVFVSPCPGSEDEYPPQIYVCEFHCFEPVYEGADCSALIVVWFADDLRLPIPEFVSSRVGDIDWEQHAVDGWY